jgi:hypothetical protein
MALPEKIPSQLGAAKGSVANSRILEKRRPPARDTIFYQAAQITSAKLVGGDCLEFGVFSGLARFPVTRFRDERMISTQ